MLDRRYLRFLTFAAGLLAPLALHAAELPRTMTWTAYSAGSGTHAQMVSIAGMLQRHYGSTVRLLPGDNDIARMLPLKLGRVDLCGCGASSYLAAEGVSEYATRQWGPQRLRVVVSAMPDYGVTLLVAGDLDISHPRELRGRRIGYIKGSESLNLNTEALLAFGGLTWDDVERVTVSGYSAIFEGIADGRIDAFTTVGNAPHAYRLASGPRGIRWLDFDPDDAEGWERARKVLPYIEPLRMTVGAGVTPGRAVRSSGYPLPLLTARADLSEEVAYALVKALTEGFEYYKDAAPGNAGFALERRNLMWVMPLHDGAVRYYKDHGLWSDAMEAHQQRLVARENVLQAAWSKFLVDAPTDPAAFRDAWLDARAKALAAAGHEEVF